MGLFTKKKSPYYDGQFPDVSHWETVDFKKFEGKELITKATEGVTMIDPTFKNLKDQCRIKGIAFSAYHFFRCDKPAVQQAKHYLATLGSDYKGEYILDIETTDGSSNVAVIQFIKSWLDYVEKETGKVPMIYSGHAFLVSLDLPVEFARYPLWLARYCEQPPQAPKPWIGWTIWQFAENAVFKGIGECDGNVRR